MTTPRRSPPPRSLPLADRPGILPDITAAIGDTPLVALDRLADGVAPRLVAKLESVNPGGSVKDRIALPMIEAAERDGLLRPGGVIVEPTSGNTGVGLAMAAAVKGYRCIFVMADKQSEEKRALLRAYGAEVVVCPTDVDPQDERSYYRVSDRLARETPGAWKPDQYHNDQNPRAHELTTGPEIWEATEGRVTHFVASIGTGGTISGAGRYLRERNPELVIVGADPAGSVYSGDTPRPYLTEGIGEDFWPTTYDAGICDVIVRVSDRDSMLTARLATAREGILMGESCGTVLWAALQVAREVDDPEALFVVLLPDSGRNYVGKLYSDTWLREQGLLGPDEPVSAYDWRATTPEVIVRR
ncbi:MAG TPA: pyridoxal-phosphate dependent enzyme [Chloroflexota bacterium]|nr:pyridoxal-phosphate dependent enzyme [Candidatus Limnocylindria bacterium]HEU5316340.1 pyridoxal-phosphate dependent enzyme [Chloroflexota bacterium]